MKRASYREAIEWIAINDSAGESTAMQLGPVSDLVSAALVADIFDIPRERVGRDVIRCRAKLMRESR